MCHLSAAPTARTQTRDKRLRCPFNIRKWCCPPGPPCIPQSTQVTGPSWVAYPDPDPKLAQGVGRPFSKVSSLYDPATLVTHLFFFFNFFFYHLSPWLLHLAPLLFPSPLSSPASGSELSQMPLPLALLSPLLTVNFLLLHT